MFERIKSMFSTLWGEKRTGETPYAQSVYDKEREAELEALIQAEHEAEAEAEMAEEEARKVVEPATHLPEGFTWCHFRDGSGGLYKDGKDYASYDVNPARYIEYKVLSGRWELSYESLSKVQNDIEERVLNHLNSQRQEAEMLETQTAAPGSQLELEDEELEPEP